MQPEELGRQHDRRRCERDSSEETKYELSPESLEEARNGKILKNLCKCKSLSSRRLCEFQNRERNCGDHEEGEEGGDDSDGVQKSDS